MVIFRPIYTIKPKNVKSEQFYIHFKILVNDILFQEVLKIILINRQRNQQMPLQIFNAVKFVCFPLLNMWSCKIIIVLQCIWVMTQIRGMTTHNLALKAQNTQDYGMTVITFFSNVAFYCIVSLIYLLDISTHFKNQFLKSWLQQI